MARKGLCECGCGRRTTIYEGKPRRFISGHNRRAVVRWVEEDRGFSTPCWIWQLKIGAYGYGLAWHHGHTAHAHRAVYEEHRGIVPEGLVLDHLCRQRDCVNPDHVEPVTHPENCHRGEGTKLTAVEVQVIRALARAGVLPQTVIADRFGVTQPQVSMIKNGHRWRTA